MRAPDSSPSGRHIFTALVLVIAAVAIGTLVIALIGRPPAEVSHVEVVGDDVVRLTVQSCNANPALDSVERDGDEIRIRVRSDRPTGDDCQDLLTVPLELDGATTLVDETSGTRFQLR